MNGSSIVLKHKGSSKEQKQLHCLPISIACSVQGEFANEIRHCFFQLFFSGSLAVSSLLLFPFLHFSFSRPRLLGLSSALALVSCVGAAVKRGEVVAAVAAGAAAGMHVPMQQVVLVFFMPLSSSTKSNKMNNPE